MSRTFATTLPFVALAIFCLMPAEPAWAEKASIAERTVINPGLGPCPTQVLRDTPAAAWHSFLQFGGRGDFSLAVHLLDLTEVSPDQQRTVGEDLARKLFRVFEALGAGLEDVSAATPEGPLVDGEPRNVVVALRFLHERTSGEAWLRRTLDASTRQTVWLFTRQTISSIPFWYRAIVEGEEAEAATPLNQGLGEVPSTVQRGNPRATVTGFLASAKSGAFEIASHYLDLGDYPAEEQPTVGRRMARRLMLVLLRTGWVNPDVVSNDEFGAPESGVADDRERLAEVEVKGKAMPLALQHRFDAMLGTVWTFSQNTVAGIDALYETHGYGWIGDHLPEVFFAAELWGLQLWQWTALVLVLAVGWAVARIVSTILLRMLGTIASRSRVQWDDEMVRTLNGPLGLVCWGGLVALVAPWVGLSDAAYALIGRGWRVLMLTGLGWIMFRSVDLMAAQLQRRAIQRDAVGLSFIPIVTRISKVLIFVLVFLAALDVIGVEVVGLLAGLGLGGLAVAFAAQKTLENLFGAIAIAGDRPFKVGDWVTIGGVSGTVEDVGLRSTRLRPLDRTLVSIPNGVVMGEKITNYGERDRILYNTTIGVVYETTADQLRFIIDEIRRVLMADPRVFPDSHRVRFSGFGASSLDISILCWILTKDYAAYTGIAEDLNFKVMDIVERAGSSFAFPTQTIHFSRDEVLDSARQEAIKTEVAQRRERGELSIPEPTEELRQQLRESDA